MRKKFINTFLVIILAVFLITAMIPSAQAAWNFGGWWASFSSPKKSSAPSPLTLTSSGSTTQTQAQVNYEQKYNQCRTDKEIYKNSAESKDLQIYNLINEKSNCYKEKTDLRKQLDEASYKISTDRTIPSRLSYSMKQLDSYSVTITFDSPITVMTPARYDSWHWDETCSKSMGSMFTCKDSLVIQERPTVLEVYDVVGIPKHEKVCGGLAEIQYPPQTYCVHQITNIEGNIVYTKGTDNTLWDNPTLKKDILFKVVR